MTVFCRVMGPAFPGFLQGHGASPRTGRPVCVSLLPTTARVAVGRRLMSYRELTMIDIQGDLRRWAAGQSARKIARETGADRKTVGRYIAAADRARGSQAAASRRRAGARGRAARAGTAAAPMPSRERRVEVLAAHRAADRSVARAEASTSVCEGPHAAHARPRRHGELRHAPSLRHRRARVAQEGADGAPRGRRAGRRSAGGLRPYGDDSRRRDGPRAAALGAHRDARGEPLPVRVAAFLQTTEAVCEGLDAAWRFFGAMARVLVPDNMTAIVERRRRAGAQARRCVPRLHAGARHASSIRRGCASPKDKARVENQVALRARELVRRRVVHCASRTRVEAPRTGRATSPGRASTARRDKCRAERSRRDEKGAMLPPPSAPFDVPVWTDAKVHPDHHVQVARALYSRPDALHRPDRARTRRPQRPCASTWRRSSSKCTRVSPRQALYRPPRLPRGQGGVRAPQRRGSARASQSARHARRHLRREAPGRCPCRGRGCAKAYALVRLCDNYGDGRVEAVCQSALAFDVVDVSRIGRMLKAAAAPSAPESSGRKVVPLATPRFARSIEHFETRSTKKEGA